MSLNILAASNARYLGERENYFDVIDEGQAYCCSAGFSIRQDGMRNGSYEFDPATAMRFNAGSHRQYGDFRKWLCWSLHNVDMREFIYSGRRKPGTSEMFYKGTPFFELLLFSDHAGFFGPKTSKRLLAAFGQHKHRMKEATEEMRLLYANFIVGFEIAADKGFLLFH